LKRQFISKTSHCFIIDLASPSDFAIAPRRAMVKLTSSAVSIFMAAHAVRGVGGLASLLQIGALGLNKLLTM
jgi:hypothetical protein